MRSKSRKIITLSAVFVVGIGVIGYSQLRPRPPAPGVPNPNNPRPKKPVYTSSWLGNTFGTPDTAIQQSIDGIAVTTDGRVFTNSAWDEGGREAGIYQDGKLIGSAQYTHGWGCGGGRTLAMNSRYLFLAMRMDSQGGQLVDSNTWPAKGLWWFGVSRRPINRPSSPASFDAGMGGRGDTLQKSFAVINEVAEGTNAEIAGLAASSDRLYMSNPYTDSIEVYDPNSMIRLGGIHVERPGKMAIDSRGMLWVIQTAGSGKSPRIIHISASGQEVSSSINDVTDPRDIALNADGRLLVAEAGPSQQILIYKVNTDPPVQVGALGVEGGVYATPRGQTGDSRLDFPHAIGADAAGNIYVAGGLNGTDLRKFSPDGNLKWQVLGLQFVDTVAADPTSDGRDVFSKFNRFSIDYTLPTGREWSWKATTIDPFRFPNDPRISTTFPKSAITATAVRFLDGRKFLFLVAESNAFLIYRFDGEIAVPSAIFGSKIYNWMPGLYREGRFIWRDLNGDGDFQSVEFSGADGVMETDAWSWDVDLDGNVWEAREQNGIFKFALQGIDAAGNPVYRRGASTHMDPPEPFTAVERTKYLSDTDTMYLSGYTHDHPKAENGYWGQVGTEVARYDDWSSGNRVPRYRIVLPYNPPDGSIKSLTVAGERIFAGLMNSSGSAQSASPKNLFVYDSETGRFLDQITPGPEIGSAMGWIDIGQGVNALVRKDGEYVVFMEEVTFGKTVIYRIHW